MDSNMSCYELDKQGRILEQMFLKDEIEEDVFEDSKEFLLAEMEEKSHRLIYVFKRFEERLGSGSGQNKVKGEIDKEIDRLKDLKKFYQTNFEKFSEMVANTMLGIGMKSGVGNGLQTDRGILYLRKSNIEIKPNIENVENKYKTYRIKEFDLTNEELENLPDDLKAKFTKLIKEIKINKALYEKEEKPFAKEERFTLKVK